MAPRTNWLLDTFNFFTSIRILVSVVIFQVFDHLSSFSCHFEMNEEDNQQGSIWKSIHRAFHWAMVMDSARIFTLLVKCKTKTLFCLFFFFFVFSFFSGYSVLFWNSTKMFKSTNMSHQIRESLPGSEPAKSESPTAKLRASGSRARSKKRPGNIWCVWHQSLISMSPHY